MNPLQAFPVHWSDLKHIGQSPQHYRYWLDHDIKQTAAMLFGSLVDMILFDNGPSRFVVFPHPRTGNRWRDFKAEHADKMIVTGAEVERATDVVAAVMSNGEAKKVLAAGEYQKPLTWTHNGRECAGTADVYGPDGVTDLKVTPMTNPARFSYHARSMGWATQVCWYGDQGKANDMRRTLVAVEPAPPHAVVVYDLTPGAIDMGRRVWRGYMERLAVCEKTDHWPGYAEGILELDAAEDVHLIVEGEEITL